MNVAQENPSTTGMRPGERYRVENIERAHQFPGFFLDGKYYLSPELLTTIGWLEGQRFIYDELDPEGEPVFPDRVAGEISGLELKLVDGTVLKLQRLDPSLFVESVEPPSVPRARFKSPVLLVIGALLAAGLCLAATSGRRKGR